MNDAPLPDDEIVSAHLDGEATAAERDRLSQNPVLAARAAEFARVQALVGAPTAASEQQRESAIAAALDAFDQQAVASDQSVPDLAARRAATHAGDHKASRQSRVLAVAAAVVVLLLGGAVVVRAVARGSSDTITNAAVGSPQLATRDQTKSANPNNSKAANGTAGEANTAGPASPAPTTGAARDPASPAPVSPDQIPPQTSTIPTAQVPPSSTPLYAYRGANLGTISSPEQLRRATAQAITQQASNSGGAPAPSAAPNANEAANQTATFDRLATCDATLHTIDREIGPVAFSATAIYEGTNALVLVYPIDRTRFPAANGGSRIYAVDRSTCAVLDNQTL